MLLPLLLLLPVLLVPLPLSPSPPDPTHPHPPDPTSVQVLVASIGGGMHRRRMEVAAALWAAGLRAEFGFKPAPKMADQLGYALKQGIPFLVLFGESEVEQVGGALGGVGRGAAGKVGGMEVQTPEAKRAHCWCAKGHIAGAQKGTLLVRKTAHCWCAQGTAL